MSLEKTDRHICSSLPCKTKQVDPEIQSGSFCSSVKRGHSQRTNYVRGPGRTSEWGFLVFRHFCILPSHWKRIPACPRYLH
ncbi:hypothetical protein lerEdw1_018135 [Lerista edwardsae]|nr:hypothetical protein lerEdw1_018135 [Lerista edwardsae]